MARVTAEDCVEKVPNRFELVMMAARRARDLGTGVPPTVERDDDKNPVVALREIADDGLDLDGLKEQLIRGHQRVIEEASETEDEIIDLMEGELMPQLSAAAEDDESGEAETAEADDELDEEALVTVDTDERTEELDFEPGDGGGGDFSERD